MKEVFEDIKQSDINGKLQYALIFLLGLELILQIFNPDRFLNISGMYIPLLVFLAVALVYVIKDPLYIRKTCLSLVIMMLGLLLSLMFHLKVTESGYLLTYLVVGLTLFVLWSIKWTPRQIRVLINLYIVMAVAIALLIIIFQNKFDGTSALRLTIKIGNGDYIDPNFLSLMMVAPFLFLFARLFMPAKLIEKIISLICFIIIGTGMLLTTSRATFVAVGLGILIYIIKAWKNIITKKRVIIGIIIIAVIIIVAIIIIPKEKILRLVDIKSYFDTSTFSRFQRWKEGLLLVKKSPIVGEGITSTAALVEGNTGTLLSVHGTYLEIWIHLGILGIVGFIMMIIKTTFTKKTSIATAIGIATAVGVVFNAAETMIGLWANFAIVEMINSLELTKEERLLEKLY